MATDIAEVFTQIVNSRRSVRAFKPEPVPQALQDKVFSVAQRAPSNCNTQPWQVHVASGQTCERLREAIPQAFAAGKITQDFVYEGVYHGVYKDRQYAAAATLYQAAGIERGDKASRQAQFMDNFRFFGAPHVAFLFLPEHFGLREAADLGMYAQNLMLSLTAHGLASCPQTALSFNADTVREILGVDDSQKLLMGLSFGYEDAEAPVNQARTERAVGDEAVTFHN